MSIPYFQLFVHYLWIAVLLILMVSESARAQFSGGEGSEADPWQIEEAEDLRNVADYSDDYFVQTADIDLADVNNFEPIGDTDNLFTGVYDGDEYHIKDLSITDTNAEGYTGLFSIVAGEIRNLILEDIEVTGTEFTGGLAGILIGTVNDCKVTGSVESEVLQEEFSRTGLLIGASEGATISQVYTEGNVFGNGQKVGGIVGYIRSSTISDSESEAEVSGEEEEIGGVVGAADQNSLIENTFAHGDVNGIGEVEDTGGLVGELQESKVTGSGATGNVESDGDEIGGLVGEAEDSSRIADSYATGDVRSGDDQVGGLVGKLQESIIEHSHATGNVTGERAETGGLVGQTEAGSRISHSYATGAVNGEGDNVGGLVGENENSVIEYSYATGNVSGNADEVGGLAGENEIGSIIRYSYATGNVSGRDEDIGGLVGQNSESIIEYSFATGNVTGAEEVGGLVGENDDNGIIRYAYSEGNVTATSHFAGGLVGDNNESRIYDSFSRSEVQGNNEVGGIAGRNSGEVHRTYWAAAEIQGNSQVGAIAGAHVNGSLENNFWDEEVSGWPTGIGSNGNEGATGYETSQMQLRQTYEGWDFDDVWGIEEGEDYPFLRGIEEADIDIPEIPEEIVLHQNYPNPFNPVTHIEFEVPDATDIRLEVYDATGRLVSVLKDEEVNAGRHEVRFDASELASGVYIYRVASEFGERAKSMTFIK